MKNGEMLTNDDLNDDLLWQHIKTVPAFRALLRSVEARTFRGLELPEPVLDIGCGDGHFAKMAFKKQLTVGIDPWWGPLKKAHQLSAHRLTIQCLGGKLPFPDNTFRSVISNSVLEHIPEVDLVLSEAARILHMEGQLFITMPSHFFTEKLGGAIWFERFGLKGLADSYRRGFNQIARHVHVDSPLVWAERLAKAGFVVKRWHYYFSENALHTLEIGHIQGFPSALLHGITGHWILAPWRSNLYFTEKWIRPFYEEDPPLEGTMIFIVAQKQSINPIDVSLPPAQVLENS